MPHFYNEPLSFWQELTGWPGGCVAVILPGWIGHEQEIVLRFHDAENTGNFFEDSDIPDFLIGLTESVLPETWRVDSRGTRLEIHPSGRFYGGFDDFDVAAVENGMRELGFKPEVRPL